MSQLVSSGVSNQQQQTTRAVDLHQETQGQLPRRRWSRRMGSADEVLMVTSMLDLRLLDSYCPHEDQQGGQEVGRGEGRGVEEQEPEEGRGGEERWTIWQQCCSLPLR